MKGFIYQIGIEGEDYPNIYVGSTEDMQKRLKKHEYACNSDYRTKSRFYDRIRSAGGWKAISHKIRWSILEEVEVKDRVELIEIEDWWITAFYPNYNINKVSIGGREKYARNRLLSEQEKLFKSLKSLEKRRRNKILKNVNLQ